LLFHRLRLSGLSCRFRLLEVVLFEGMPDRSARDIFAHIAKFSSQISASFLSFISIKAYLIDDYSLDF